MTREIGSVRSCLINPYSLSKPNDSAIPDGNIPLVSGIYTKGVVITCTGIIYFVAIKVYRDVIPINGDGLAGVKNGVGNKRGYDCLSEAQGT